MPASVPQRELKTWGLTRQERRIPGTNFKKRTLYLNAFHTPCVMNIIYVSYSPPPARSIRKKGVLREGGGSIDIPRSFCFPVSARCGHENLAGTETPYPFGSEEKHGQKYLQNDR
mgnify:CR=1 FL=1